MNRCVVVGYANGISCTAVETGTLDVYYFVTVGNFNFFY